MQKWTESLKKESSRILEVQEILLFIEGGIIYFVPYLQQQIQIKIFEDMFRYTYAATDTVNKDINIPDHQTVRKC